MLSGDVVILRSVERTDLPQLLEWRNNPENRRYFREFRELNSDNQLNWYERVVLNDPNTFMFSVLEKKTNELIGSCGLCYVDWVNRNAEFSMYIGRNNVYIDDVYAFDASKVMLSYAFEELGLHRIFAEIYEFDTKKQKLLDKLKFKYEGCHRQSHWSNGKWHDSLFFGILSDEWKSENL